MTTHRAARGLLALAILLVTTPMAAPSASAQVSGSVTLSLVSQTPWNTVKDPVLEIAVRADNAGSEPLDNLTLGVTIGTAVHSRIAYETSLTQGPELPVFAATIPERDALEAGGTRRFRTSVDLSTVGGISTGDSLVYPLRVDLRSGGSPVALVDTAIIFVVRTPEAPLLLSTTIELKAATAFTPEGLLMDQGFEASIAPAGTLGAEVSALARLTHDPLSRVDLAVEPALLDELLRMADGYRRVDGTEVAKGTGGAADAETLLAQLRTVVASPEIHLSAEPFAAPSIPSLLASGLSSDLAAQFAVGRQTAHDVVGVEPGYSVVRPP